MLEEDSEFLKLISGCYVENEPVSAIENSALELLYSSISHDTAKFVNKVDEDVLNLLLHISLHLETNSSDLEFVVCSLAKNSDKQFPEEQASKLSWIVNLFSSLGPKLKANNIVEKPELKVRLINQWYGANINQYRTIKDALEESYTLKIVQSDDYDLAIDGIFSNEPIKKEAIKISYSGEAIPAKLEGYDLSLGFDYLESETNYIRLPLYYLYFGEMISTDYQRKGECNPNKPYFACFLVSNSNRGDGAEARTKMFYSLSAYKPVVSGGAYLNNIGRVIPQEETYAFLSQCKFVIAYENNGTYPGYVTEKVFQAYFAGSVPLYYSHPSGQESDLNPNAIISAQKFASEREMINRIIEVDRDDAEYCRIWNSSLLINENNNYEVMKSRIREKLQI